MGSISTTMQEGSRTAADRGGSRPHAEGQQGLGLGSLFAKTALFAGDPHERRGAALPRKRDRGISERAGTGLHFTAQTPVKMEVATCFLHTEIEEQMGVSYQKGWVRPRGKKWHGNFRRMELDSETKEPKLVTHSFVLGLRAKMSKSQAREKLENEIAKLGGRATDDQAAVNGSCHFRVVRQKPLPATEGGGLERRDCQGQEISDPGRPR